MYFFSWSECRIHEHVHLWVSCMCRWVGGWVWYFYICTHTHTYTSLWTISYPPLVFTISPELPSDLHIVILLTSITICLLTAHSMLYPVYHMMPSNSSFAKLNIFPSKPDILPNCHWPLKLVFTLPDHEILIKHLPIYHHKYQCSNSASRSHIKYVVKLLSGVLGFYSPLDLQD